MLPICGPSRSKHSTTFCDWRSATSMPKFPTFSGSTPAYRLNRLAWESERLARSAYLASAGNTLNLQTSVLTACPCATDSHFVILQFLEGGRWHLVNLGPSSTQTVFLGQAAGITSACDPNRQLDLDSWLQHPITAVTGFTHHGVWSSGRLKPLMYYTQQDTALVNTSAFLVSRIKTLLRLYYQMLY